NSLRAEDTA
nr:immunoglobulin heavy chain junction region [Homo sapiens]